MTNALATISNSSHHN